MLKVDHQRQPREPFAIWNTICYMEHDEMRRKRHRSTSSMGNWRRTLQVLNAAESSDGSLTKPLSSEEDIRAGTRTLSQHWPNQLKKSRHNSTMENDTKENYRTAKESLEIVLGLQLTTAQNARIYNIKRLKKWSGNKCKKIW